MNFQFTDTKREETWYLVSHEVPRVGDDVVVEVDNTTEPSIFRLYRVTKVVWFTQRHDTVFTAPHPGITLPGVEGEEVEP